MKIDYALQRELLLRLREHYPEIVDLRPLDLWDREGFHQNAFYLDEHGLIERVGARIDVLDSPSLMLTARLTKRGLDFLEEDGGLSAILKQGDRETRRGDLADSGRGRHREVHAPRC